MNTKYIYIFLYCLSIGFYSNAQWYGRIRNLPTSEKILERLNTYYTNDVKEIYSPEVFKPGKNVNDSIKLKLISLLRDYWTEEELDKIVESKFREDFEYIFFQGIMEKSIDRTKEIYFNHFSDISIRRRSDSSITFSKSFRTIHDSVYSSIYDSTAQVYREKLRNGYKKRRIPDEIIKSVATANVREAIPILKEALLTNNALFNKEVVELSLARFGDKKIQEKLINQNTTKIDPKIKEKAREISKRCSVLRFISTQESIYQMHIFLDSTLKETRIAGSQTYMVYSGGKAIWALIYTIINKDFQEKFKDVDPDYLDDVDLLLFARNWLIKNKGKYEIYQAFGSFD